jgi:hypothetical protein
MSTNVKPAGKALYLEFRHGINTNQVILTPEGATLSGKVVPMTAYRRRISPSTPRKSWKQFSSAVVSDQIGAGTFAQYSTDHALSTVRDRIGFTDSLFNQLIMQGWTLYKQPIAVEVTVEDLDEIRMGKTPYKILGRITRCRRTLEFGESLFAS